MERETEQIIFDCIGRLLRQANENQLSADGLIKKLESNITDYSLKHNNFQKEIKTSITQTLESSVSNQLAKIVREFESAKEKAELAAIEYEKSSKKASWRMTWVGILLILSGAIGAYGFLFFYVPSPAYVNSLRTEVGELQANIKFLKKAGAHVVFTQCPLEDGSKRGCVRVDRFNHETFKDKNGNEYRIID